MHFIPCLKAILILGNGDGVLNCIGSRAVKADFSGDGGR
jgi:hypothetical protein